MRPDINSFVMMIKMIKMIKRMVLERSSLIAIRAWTLDGENSQMGGTMLVDEKRVHPEVEQFPVVHISWPVQQFSIYAAEDFLHVYLPMMFMMSSLIF